MFAETSITDPDASGGLGSMPRDLWGVLTGALDVVAAPALGRLLDLNIQTTQTPTGELRHAAAPTPPPSAATQVANALRNPMVIGGLIAVGVLLVVVLVRRK